MFGSFFRHTYFSCDLFGEKPHSPFHPRARFVRLSRWSRPLPSEVCDVSRPAGGTGAGSIIWDFNSVANTFDGVNGIKAKGGMMNAGGPVIVSGVLYVNAGYGGIQGQPGNVLLAFTVDGK